MQRRLIFGQYRPADSVMHRLDPRAKLLISLLLMITALLTEAALFYVIFSAALVIMLRLSKINFGEMARNIGPFLILILITALYHLIFSARDTKELLNIYGFAITEGGLEMAAIFSLRIILFICIAFIIALTISPSDMGESIVYTLRPFKRFGLPVHDIGLVLFIAMRFIPVLAEEFDTIRKAQIIRGADFSGNLIRRAKKSTMLLIPVFQSALRRADDLALAIEARGYVSGAERSSLREFRFAGTDWLFMILSITLIASVYLRFGR